MRTTAVTRRWPANPLRIPSIVSYASESVLKHLQAAADRVGQNAEMSAPHSEGLFLGMRIKVDGNMPSDRVEIRDARGNVLHTIFVDDYGRGTLSIVVPR